MHGKYTVYVECSFRVTDIYVERYDDIMIVGYTIY